jgi:hypothetical protein
VINQKEDCDLAWKGLNHILLPTNIILICYKEKNVCKSCSYVFSCDCSNSLNFFFLFFCIDRDEFKFINEIVQVISKMVSHTYLNIAKYPIEIESRLRDINVLLSIGMNERRMVLWSWWNW